ncbi:hypothetical protein [[Phormidium] sp. ETS-05]|uniref:hypothetical protein n=1 Tax=[Phormidium] sp. ETS-05 TaxID=222819 RepID=UPI0018EF1963|nr:hypothetical protein [[Phormidium] sp. ETS-05]
MIISRHTSDANLFPKKRSLIYLLKSDGFGALYQVLLHRDVNNWGGNHSSVTPTVGAIKVWLPRNYPIDAPGLDITLHCNSEQHPTKYQCFDRRSIPEQAIASRTLRNPLLID